MKTLLWILAGLTLAVSLTIAAKYNDGLVLLIFPPYRAELSLNLFVVLSLAAFIALYSLARMVQHTISLPGYVQAFRLSRRQNKARAALSTALTAFFEGRYVTAEKQAAAALAMDESPAVSALLAAQAAHRLRAFDRRDDYLAQAEKKAPEQNLARLITQADLLLDQRHPDEALAALKTLSAKDSRHPYALRLELKALQQAKMWDQIPPLVGQLEKREAIDSTQAEQVKINAYVENLKRKSDDLPTLKEFWQKLPGDARLQNKVALQAAQAFIASGDCQTAADIAGTSLERQWDSELAAVYGYCPGRDLLKQIERAEAWLKQYPRDAALLLSLGRLCMLQALWGKAQSYLEASLAVEATPHAHLLLAELLENLNRPDEACKHYRSSLEMSLKNPLE
ncbi:MAG: heme biosynthesis HemY N-terminal domain-containing protein [Burkholderiales bacterium]